MSDVPWIEAATIGSEDAHATWALAARMRLEEVASGYHQVITLEELADYVQQRSRVRTRQQPRHWMGDVLYRTMEADASAGEPFLASLCVDVSGHVGSGYAGCVEFLRGETVPDADRHAGQERLDCYRRHSADLPADGGEPGPWPTAPAARPARSTAPRSPRAPRAARPAAPGRVARTDVVPKICPRCFMALPASGQCDTCD